MFTQEIRERRAAAQRQAMIKRRMEKGLPATRREQALIIAQRHIIKYDDRWPMSRNASAKERYKGCNELSRRARRMHGVHYDMYRDACFYIMTQAGLTPVEPTPEPVHVSKQRVKPVAPSRSNNLDLL